MIKFQIFYGVIWRYWQSLLFITSPVTGSESSYTAALFLIFKKSMKSILSVVLFKTSMCKQKQWPSFYARRAHIARSTLVSKEICPICKKSKNLGEGRITVIITEFQNNPLNPFDSAWFDYTSDRNLQNQKGSYRTILFFVMNTRSHTSSLWGAI